jgi:hypothetical protein
MRTRTNAVKSVAEVDTPAESAVHIAGSHANIVPPNSAIVAFLGTAADPEPTRANMVDRLANPTRTERELSGQGRQLEDWLADEMRIRGIRENAAVLAVLEVSKPGSALAQAYAERYPDRLPELTELLAVLNKDTHR